MDYIEYLDFEDTEISYKIQGKLNFGRNSLAEVKDIVATVYKSFSHGWNKQF